MALIAASLFLIMMACGSAASNDTPKPTHPTISSFTPTSGAAGTAVVVTGANFTGATAVTFNGKAAAGFSVDSPTQITATVASGSTTGQIMVTTLAGTAPSSTVFTVLGLPTVVSFTPTSGAAGTSVTIAGTNFTRATSVKFTATAAASFTVNSDTQITATVASGTTTGKISVTTPNGIGFSSGLYAVPLPPPTISSLSPGTGAVGTAVAITGTNFGSVSSVKFNGTSAASFTVNSATQITATVANGSTTGKVTVTTASGTATSAADFTVTAGTALDLSIEGLYITQATQEYPNPVVPLVQGRSAWVRVFVKANQANTVTPQVKVDFKTGATTHTLTINAGGSSVPLSIDPENAAASWNAAVDQSWILPSTQVTATVDPANVIPETDETNNTFTQNLNVQNVKPWKVTLVPVQTGSSTGNVQTSPRTKMDWVDFAKRIHPVPDAIDVIVGSPMVSSVSSVTNDINVWSTILNEVTAKRSADNVTDRYYFGALHAGYSSGIAGLGWIGFPAAIGWDANGSFASVFAHEEGHNFNRPHSPCGGASSPDPNYPYPGAIIGVPG
ncbi:MAG TPA: IPT/TIG domain-containing protein [Terriglobales bacterium]|nr:IPT/TIG domain-containing protein [Terriglobales bacterium]